MSLQLRKQIGTEGDTLLGAVLPHVQTDRAEVPFDPIAMTNPYGTVTGYLRRRGWPHLLILPAYPLDTLLTVVRLLLYFLVATWVWRVERKVGHLLGRTFFCPLCSNPMKDPLVYCSECNHVQPQLRPCRDAPFVHTCWNCGGQSWSILGQYLLYRPGPLVCRDTDQFTGCYRPHPLPEVAGRYRSHHVAIAGTTTRAKHAVMAYLFGHLCEGGSQSGGCVPAWRLSELELQLCRTVLWRGFQVDTAAYDQPGDGYTLALSFILHEQRHSRLLVFHNLANAWLGETASLVKKVVNWKLLRGLVLVLDPERMGRIDDPTMLPQSEVYCRLLRVMEEYCALAPGCVVPLRVSVVVPVPAGAAARLGVPALSGGMSSEEAKRLVHEQEPALHALLVQSVRPDRLRFFAGVIPDRFDLEQTKWLGGVLAWVR